MSELSGARQIVLVTSRWKNKDDIITIAWHMPTSFVPEMYVISIGNTRYSNWLIKKSKSFCINFMPASLKNEIIYCGSIHGNEHDKFSEAKLEKVECERINCPRIKQAFGYAECKVVKVIKTGDHMIFIARVLNSKVLNKGKRLYHFGKDRFGEL
jgi:flavin reductase (DIM6/NTAB) family NADH-FMN oxidoreductase RutF